MTLRPMLRKSVEFLVPASATPGFYGQIAMLRKSIHEFYPDARIVAMFGAVPETDIPEIEGVEVHRVEPSPGHRAQIMARYRLINPAADVSILCDADTMMIRPVDELIEEMDQDPALAGVLCLSPPPHPVKFSMLNSFYVNHGFLCSTPKMLASLYQSIIPRIAALSDYPDQFWVPQIAIPYAAHDARLPVFPLPLRFNFPNDGAADAEYPDELADVRVLHYMNCGEYDRGRIFCEPQAFAEFMDKPLTGSSRVLQERVRTLTGGVFPGIVQKRTL